MGLIAESGAEVARLSGTNLTERIAALGAEGWTVHGHDILPDVSVADWTYASRKDHKGNGGDACFGSHDQFGRNGRLNLKRSCVEGYMRFACLRPETNGTIQLIGQDALTQQLHWTVDMTIGGELRLLTDSNIYRVSHPTFFPIDSNNWIFIEIHFRIDEVGVPLNGLNLGRGGLLEVVVDRDYANPTVFVGDVYDNQFGFEPALAEWIFMAAGSHTAFDDTKVQDVTIRYVPGAGAPLINDGIRFKNGGGTTIARGIITGLFTDDDGVTIFQLRELEDGSGPPNGPPGTGVAWDGLMATDPTNGVATIEEDVAVPTWNATAEAKYPGLDPESGWPGEGFYRAKEPRAHVGGESTPLSVFPSGTNLAAMDDGVFTVADAFYVFSGVNNDNDSFEFYNSVALDPLLPPVGDIAGGVLKGMSVYMRVAKDGTGIDNFNFVTKDLTFPAQFTPDITLPVGFATRKWHYRENPRTAALWTHSEAEDAHHGIRMRT